MAPISANARPIERSSVGPAEQHADAADTDERDSSARTSGQPRQTEQERAHIRGLPAERAPKVKIR